MTPQIAALACWCGIFGLFYLERDRGTKTSPAIWIAVIWVFIGASRMASQWLGLGGGVNSDSPGQYLDGSPLDATLLTSLLAIGLVVLLTRAKQVMRIIRANPLLTLFFLYCLVSVLWSDFPLVAFKRWTKFLGNFVMVLLVLTDRDPRAATKRLFARTAFLLIPLSVLLCRYYPGMGRGYTRWNWQSFYMGVATDKNGLGAVCLIFGLASLWQFMDAYRDRTRAGRQQSLVAHGIILAMNLWLLSIANSSTSTACFGLASALILITMRKRKPRPTAVHGMVAFIVCLGLVFYMFDDVSDAIIHALGRQPDLSGRTDLWNDILHLHLNPIIGTGFESFWLGPRAEFFWKKYPFHPNQAHNGYLEAYLNLGWIGAVLLGLVIIAGYPHVIRAFQRNLPLAPLRLPFLVIPVVYNMTEAAFKVMHPVFIAFLFAIITVPERRIRTGTSVLLSRAGEHVPRPPQAIEA